jgi:hypothetical protein
VQKAGLEHTQKGLTGVGEQKPHGPQSASMRQLLPVRHEFAALSDVDARQAQGWLAGQSESLKQPS